MPQFWQDFLDAQHSTQGCHAWPLQLHAPLSGQSLTGIRFGLSQEGLGQGTLFLGLWMTDCEFEGGWNSALSYHLVAGEIPLKVYLKRVSARQNKRDLLDLNRVPRSRELEMGTCQSDI